ncbi:MAG: RidA family protein [Proteobacteria bacterium]|nr:RidA family protein [Pseudomonadota bacterium]MCP4920404.1 RidA family protein [Pseudomonadota bacterium]
MSDPRTVHTDDAPAAIGPYSQAVVHGDTVYCSGQVALLPGTGELYVGDIQGETRQVLANLEAVLEAAGSGLDRCLKVQVFLKDLGDFGAVNAVYAEAFGDHKPARACVEVARLPKDVRVEIDAVAALR